jgi:anti-sigma factor RsiW
MTSIPNEGDLVRYLLGRMPEEEREALERHYFGESELFERLLAAEADLADAFVRGELPKEDRVAFEERLRVSPIIRERERFARALLAHGEVPASGARSSLARRLALAAAAALVLGAGLFTIEALRLRGERERLLAERARLAAEVRRLEGEAGAANERLAALSRRVEELVAAARPRSPRVVALTLVPGLLRGSGDSNRLVVPPDVDAVDLDMPLEAAKQATFAVSLRRAAGKLVTAQTGLRPARGPSGPVLSMRVDGGRLPPGDYIVTVDGEREGRAPETVVEFALRVVHKP